MKGGERLGKRIIASPVRILITSDTGITAKKGPSQLHVLFKKTVLQISQQIQLLKINHWNLIPHDMIEIIESSIE